MTVKDKSALFLGIDTSAYTTSLALVDGAERIIYDRRRLLPVGKNQLGLRQADAVFAHLQNLPHLFEQAKSAATHLLPAAVAVSVKPRPRENSYMPVFKVGETLGLFLHDTAGVRYYPSTHQEGHLIAGLWSAGLPLGRYLAIHLSGGTTELLSVEETAPGNLNIDLLGGTEDLNAGQFVDRIGLAMGLEFPAGSALEHLAEHKQINASEIKLPVAVRGRSISFSGPASQAERLLDQGCSHAALARAVEICIARSLIAAVRNLSDQQGPYQGLLAVGGVMGNKTIRAMLAGELKGWKVYFADSSYASDNAVGLAVQARRLFFSCRG